MASSSTQVNTRLVSCPNCGSVIRVALALQRVVNVFKNIRNVVFEAPEATQQRAVDDREERREPEEKAESVEEEEDDMEAIERGVAVGREPFWE